MACLAASSCMSTVARTVRVEWHSVNGICGRVYDEIEVQMSAGRFDGLQRIGIDEMSYRKGRKYLTVVIDHSLGCIVWAHWGYGQDALNLFFDEMVRERRRVIEIVTAAGEKWNKTLVSRRCPNARWAMDPFHVVEWMNNALDKVRRMEWRMVNAEVRVGAEGEDAWEGLGRARMHRPVLGRRILTSSLGTAGTLWSRTLSASRSPSAARS